jgi:hypothetical protein
VITTAGCATVSGMAEGGPATGGARGVRRSLALGKLSRLEIETIECLLRAPEQGHLVAPP